MLQYESERQFLSPFGPRVRPTLLLKSCHIQHLPAKFETDIGTPCQTMSQLENYQQGNIKYRVSSVVVSFSG